MFNSTLSRQSATKSSLKIRKSENLFSAFRQIYSYFLSRRDVGVIRSRECEDSRHSFRRLVPTWMRPSIQLSVISSTDSKQGLTTVRRDDQTDGQTDVHLCRTHMRASSQEWRRMEDVSFDTQIHPLGTLFRTIFKPTHTLSIFRRHFKHFSSLFTSTPDAYARLTNLLVSK